MPRIENAGANVVAWIDASGERPTKHDLCCRCYRELLWDGEAWHDKLTTSGPGEPVGEDGWEGVDHPSYDSDLYVCRVCGKELLEMTDGDGADC